MTPELIDLVQHEEGLRLTPYLCPAGYPTIGYGHRIQSLGHPPITEHQADVILECDLELAEAQALKLCPNLATEPRRLAALTDLCFNVGRDALDGLSVSDLNDDAGVIRCLRAKDWSGAAARFRRWNHAKTYDKALGKSVLKPLAGLTRRRNAGARWIEAGG